MYRKREAQGDLLKETAWIFGDQKVQALQKSWAGKFREQCLGMLDESPFVGLYSEKGRPCTSVRVLLGVMVLQACRDMSDQQALDALTFDVRWQYALAVGMDEVAPSRRTLVGFRGKVMEGDYLSVLFHVQVGKLMEMCNGIHGLQRMDSTEVVSRVRALTRLQNLVALMQKVLQGLSRHAPELLASAPQSLRLRYRTSCGDDAGFGDVPATKARRRLSVVARDLGRLVTALDAWPGPISPKLADTLALLRKMVNEQCELLATPESGTGDDEDAGEAPVAYRLRPKEMIPRDAVQTPHDPDLRRSGKSGNAVHRVVITETCAPPPAPDAPADAVAAPAIITDIRVEDGHATDQGCAEAVLETLSEQGYTPGQLLADAAFCGQAHVEACAERCSTAPAPTPHFTALTPLPSAETAQSVAQDAPLSAHDSGSGQGLCPAQKVRHRSLAQM